MLSIAACLGQYVDGLVDSGVYGLGEIRELAALPPCYQLPLLCEDAGMPHRHAMMMIVALRNMDSSSNSV